MKDDNGTKVTAFIAIISFVVVAIFKGKHFQAELWDSITTAISITVGARFIFMKWLWKYLPLEWLHNTPLIEGTWHGDFESTWSSGPNEPKARGKIEVRIAQPFLGVFKVTQTSNESMSYSLSESIEKSEDGTFHITFSYRNEPSATVRDRSAINYGTARYRLESTNEVLMLTGDYFTDRRTTGSVRLIKT